MYVFLWNKSTNVNGNCSIWVAASIMTAILRSVFTGTLKRNTNAQHKKTFVKREAYGMELGTKCNETWGRMRWNLMQDLMELGAESLKYAFMFLR